MVDWHLLPSEKPIHEAKISRKVPYFFRFYLISLILIVAGITLLFYKITFTLPVSKYVISLVLIILAILIDFIFVERIRNKERILITTERVLVRKVGGGIVTDVESGQTEMEQMDLSKLVNISVKQKGFLNKKILSIGDLVIRVPGGDHTIRNIDTPYKVERAIYRILEEEKKIGKIK